MANRPILRLQEPRKGRRIKTRSGWAKSTELEPDRHVRQGQRFGAEIEKLERALATKHGFLQLRNDPTGIAPERALVFVAESTIGDLARAAEQVGIEILSETDVSADYAPPESYEYVEVDAADLTLYATIPTENGLRTLLRIWKSYSNGNEADRGYAPWWNLFGKMAELRTWGQKDRFPERSQRELIKQLEGTDGDYIPLEIEVWPVASKSQRRQWKREIGDKIHEIHGEIVDESSIDDNGFVYEAVLAKLPVKEVQQMIENVPYNTGALLLDGVQFILPQTIAQSIASQSDPVELMDDGGGTYPDDLPCRAILLDGTMVENHPDLRKGVVVEDVHGYGPFSAASDRKHGTHMASLILRGDLDADGALLQSAKLMSIQVLVDTSNRTVSKDDKLFVDVIHKTLNLAFANEDPLAPDAFVVNFSVGLLHHAYAGQVSSLARLLDWWANYKGVLFIVSAGNIEEDLNLGPITGTAFEDMSVEERREMVLSAQREQQWKRTLIPPSESLNTLCVGALSKDISSNAITDRTEIIVQREKEDFPQVASACGPGHLRSIKPDILNCGGRQVLDTTPKNGELFLGSGMRSLRSGLFVARVPHSPGDKSRTRGTSAAAALTTREILRAASALTEQDGPYQGQSLNRRDLALLTRALIVNAADWSKSALDRWEEEKLRFGSSGNRASEETAKYFGFGALDGDLAREAPSYGATLVGLGEVQKDGALIYEVPIPSFLSGAAIGRKLKVTVAWFSPTNPARARYRLAALRVRSILGDIDEDEERDNIGGETEEEDWGLGMKGGPLRKDIIDRGTVWSRYFVEKRKSIPAFKDEKTMPLQVECRDASGGGMGKNESVKFALAVTLKVEQQMLFDVYEEIRKALAVPIRVPKNSQYSQ